MSAFNNERDAGRAAMPDEPQRRVDDGGYAFPVAHLMHEGMTLRDWFAGQALAGLLAEGSCSEDSGFYARNAYRCADAMILARGAHNDR